MDGPTPQSMLRIVFVSERTLENHESVLACYQRVEQQKDCALMLKLNDTMFEMFIQPKVRYLYIYIKIVYVFVLWLFFVIVVHISFQNCWLYRTLDIDHKTEMKITKVHISNCIITVCYCLLMENGLVISRGN